MPTLYDLATSNPVIGTVLKLEANSPPGSWPVVGAMQIPRSALFNILFELCDVTSHNMRHVVCELMLDLIYARFEEPSSKSTQDVAVVGNCLDISGRVSSSELPLRPGSISAKELECYIQKLLPDARSAYAVTTLILSDNELRNPDMAYAAAAVQLLPLCRAVKLRRNRFGYGTPDRAMIAELRKIVENESVRFVDVAGEMFTGSDWQEAFSDWPEALWQKLVFIPLVWLKGHNWNNPDICGPFVAASRACHERYYASNEPEPIF
ncbi:hypothetical protein CAOG_02272 [Capsaspora owczarzaki ATCC 30864]|uniref:Uncharacterized protein n=1 Tax=Capsaspora owczarzaki (strain ATCC 30864) TaxID=595528 RepID=A0A0D2WM17_CAPO3|nr:hypothetical protein CAOG_02272 [Capsaspora owczarzaki ATCC 30864]KJE91083.1 hypothetical protein CAOG_002272 [Capsaspora owczarzaki ATCC 30864]|eukprot:XP_004349022.1 hypothetical protein CAOG_02272 [Capsaspora owczarzaki ATCC 30864]